MYGFDPKKYGLQNKQEQFASFAPQQPVDIQPASFGQAPFTSPEVQKQSQQKPQQSSIPQQAMQTYAPEVTNPGKNFKGISQEDEDKLLKITNNNVLKAEALYPKILQYKNDQLFLKDRKNMFQDALVEASQGTDKQKKDATTRMVKIGQLTDYIREDALNKGAVGVSDKSDDELLSGIIKMSPVGEERAMSFINNYLKSDEDVKTTTDKILGRYVKEEVAQPEGNTIQNIGEGMRSYAGGIPEAIGKTGILDKPAELLARGVAKVTGKEFKEGQPSFSDTLNASQVGGNPDSAVAKGVETGLNVTEIVGGIVPAVKAISRAVGKKAIKASKGLVTDIISEPETKKTIQKAIQENRLQENTVGRIKRFLVGEKGDKILPTKQIQEATDIIFKNVPKPAKTPSALYQQVKEVIKTKSTALSSKLKQVTIPKSTLAETKTVDMKRAVKELTKLTDEFTNTEIKNINKAYKDISKSTNLNDLWEARKNRDDLFSNAVKQADNASAPSTRKASTLWKNTRDILNGYIDDIAGDIGDTSVKSEFKDMSALFKANSNIVESSATKMLKPTEGIINVKNALTTAGGVVGLSLYNKLSQ